MLKGEDMASLYKKDNGIYMLAVSFQKKRVTRSLGTKCIKEAKYAAPFVESEIYRDILDGRIKLTIINHLTNN